MRRFRSFGIHLYVLFLQMIMGRNDIINNLLNSNTMNHSLAMITRKYSDILLGLFEIGKVVGVLSEFPHLQILIYY